ncbi:MAG: hypothetical protein CMB80_14460 [Flammeovirgaceae bacterium]|nr:hypothetical protein [Flammeovirgaceae bacterium]MBE62056.1 hypothetical protein [Flammeovirgaceae bacterium]|tara:strand:- start:7225 stop:10368 length:3144 start_codon:yes stop_codon:yes gene_type:complete
MKAKFSPSVNIIRDQSTTIDYIPTPNAKRVAQQIADLSQSGFRNFSIIGSYGSGKSSFLWAFQRDLLGSSDYFGLKHKNQFEFIRMVGEYGSLQEKLSELIGSAPDSKELFKKLKKEGKQQVLILDEFGKFVEYAVRNQPEKEIYFFQQLAEFVADEKNNCLLITTLHQSFDAYSGSHLSEAEKNEWRKVKGRFKDLTFNEPVEQLLFLAAQKIGSKKGDQKIIKQNLELQDSFSIVRSQAEFLSDIGSNLWPLDIFSAYILAIGLQRYGQNERSLFTYLEGEFEETSKKQVFIADIHNYLNHEFYSYLRSDKNLTDFNGWKSIANGIERTETRISGNIELAQVIVKTIGLISMLGHKGANVNDDFFKGYLNQYSSKEIEAALQELEVKKIILFTKYNNAYRLIDGTDVDFAEEIKAADKEVGDYIDIAAKVKQHFEFSVVNAKAITYQLGTPRFFEYVVSETPIQQTPKDQIDGYVNLVFNTEFEIGELKEISKDQEETIYAFFNNSGDIKELLIDIERTSKARLKNHFDKEATKEFDNILRSQKALLNKSVIEALFSEQVSWIGKGEEISISSSKTLNKELSKICREVYSNTPQFKNELVNRHILVGAVGAKKPYFKHLVENSSLEDIGLPKDKFPAEKTIYLTLLKETGIHSKKGNSYQFTEPTNSFEALWKKCEEFLESSKKEKNRISDLFDILSEKPFKLTAGFLEFWIPTFLFIKRDEFALFTDNEGYQPELTESHLHAFTRTPKDFKIKAFDVAGVKLDLYNKYRELLLLDDEQKVNNQSLIESVKPFMVFYHHLNQYAKTTDKLTAEAKQLRKAIEKAQDPEKLFFEELPNATKTDINDLLKDQDQFDEYIQKIRAAIRNLQSCFDQLLDRIELFLSEELLGKKNLEFAEYKSLIEQRFSSLKEHMLIPKQTALLIRLRTPLDDRNSWINSICHVVMGKNLELIKDKEEVIFKEKLRSSFQELDNMVVLEKERKNDQEKLLKIDISSLEEGTKGQVIRIPNELNDEALDTMNNVKKALGKNKNLNKFILLNLLKQQLDD